MRDVGGGGERGGRGVCVKGVGGGGVFVLTVLGGGVFLKVF